MALILAKFNGGTTRAKLSAILGVSTKQFRQFTLYADPDNSGSVYLGPATVTSVPANETGRLKAGVSINLGPQDCDRPFVVDTDRLYAVGSAASQVLYLIVNTDDGR
jgi:hypothetical protein